MAIFTPNEGLIRKLTQIKAYSNWIVELYKNDYTPVAGSIASNFTRCDFPGYAGLAASFGAVAINAGGQAEMTSALLTFTQTAAQVSTVYGYAVVNNTGTEVLFAERFGTPINLALAGDTIRLQIVDQLGRA